MTHEVFISYSHHDKLIADGVCANLESAGIRCWIAPRDIAPGHDWPTSISEAIKKSHVFVLIFSSRSNSSRDVGRELILAANNNCIIVPFKIEDVAPEPGKEYYLARTHWLDAMDPPTQEQVDKLVSCVHALLVEAGVEFPGKPSEKQPPVIQILQPPPADLVENIPPPPTICQESKASIKESQPASPPASTSARSHQKTTPQLPIKKPRSTRGRVLGFTLGGLVLVVGVILLLQLVFKVPLLAAIFPEPTPTSTLTKTPPPLVTPSPTTTQFPTRTPLPTWVTDFAEPILASIETRDFDFEGQQILDYRNWLDANCAPPNIDMADNSYSLFANDCKLSWKSWFTDFVIRMVVRMEPVVSREPDSRWTFYYRSFNGFDFFYDGRVESAFEGGLEEPNALLPGSVENEIIIIVKDQEHAVIINNQPIYYGQLPSGYKNGIASWNVRDPVTFKVIEIWDINSLP